MNTPSLDPFTFFLWNKPRLVVDIRPLGAFLKGSLKGAVSLPMDECDTMQDFVDQLEKIRNEHPLHLIDLDGKTAMQLAEKTPIAYLEGGYKGFKNWREHAFHTGPPLYVLGGYTGSGKSALLQHLKVQGHQVIDLEELASHKGSVFGDLPELAQPLHEHFQNRLLSLWLSLNPKVPVWIEEKGPFLGRVGIPASLQLKMKQAAIIHLDVPYEQRLKYILQTYEYLKGESFRNALRSLESRMGTSQNHKALHYLDTGQREKCFELLLDYYDKAYEMRRKKYWKGNIITVMHNHDDVEATVEKLNKYKKGLPGILL